MNDSASLLDRSEHFDFGKNWASYADLITEPQVAAAVAELERLVGGRLDGKRFLDIGCGSGLHSLAALRLGATEVIGVDLDSDSVATSRRVLEKMAPGQHWRMTEKSVFLLSPDEFGTFDVVYSWGVLHHTGDMYGALRAAATMVAPGGIFVFALYRATRLCWAWKIEKRWYAKASQRAQRLAQSSFIGLFKLGCLVTGRSFSRYTSDYTKQRGMDFHHDVHDWMGGWPYESISPAQTESFMTELRLQKVRAFAEQTRRIGFFGSGCDEYVYARPRDNVTLG